MAATPEEIVRQKLLNLMVGKLGFPKELLAVEKKISELPHLVGKVGIPNRRLDILAFAKGTDPEIPLFPLLLIECKEKTPTADGKNQALGYNHYVGAPYVAVAGGKSVELIYPVELPFLPTYSELLEKISK